MSSIFRQIAQVSSFCIPRRVNDQGNVNESQVSHCAGGP